MLTTAPNPRTWAVATALAAESGLDWAAWARGETVPCPHCAKIFMPGCQWKGSLDHVPAPWDADAYRADCARRGVEPGPMPSLEYVPATGLWWKVGDHVTVTIGHGTQTLWDVLWSGDHATLRPRFRSADLDIAADGLRLATAAKRAMGGP